MALNTVSSDRLSTNVKNTNFTASEKQDLTDDILPLAGQIGNRNIVINGAMQVAQRGTSFTATGNEFTVDRFSHHTGSSFNFDTTTTQSSDAPDNFAKAIKITPDSVVTPSANQNGLFAYSIEGQDVQHLDYGTSSPQKITLSFYAKSASQNNNHQYSIQIRKVDTAGNIKHVLQPFTVTSSYQRFTFTFDGDTASDIVDGNVLGLELDFILVAGSSDLESATSTWATSGGFRAVTGQSNFMDNTSNEFFLTGVQLEVGGVATDFEHRSFTDQYLKCARYFQRLGGTRKYFVGRTSNNNGLHTSPSCAVPLRTTPTITMSGSYELFSSSGLGSSSTTPTIDTYSTDDFNNCYLGNIFFVISGSYASDARVGVVRQSNTINFDAEL